MRKNFALFVVLTPLFFAPACSSSGPRSDSPVAIAGGVEPNLTQEEANARAQVISNVKYRLAIDLDEKNDVFQGRITVAFDTAPGAQKLFLDLKNDATVRSFNVNGTAASADIRTHRLFIPDAALKTGANTAEIFYEQHYSHEGRGLHRFQDPEDGRVYLYSQFESFDAHQMFPCFDQPDLKATMTLTVSAPTSWQVVTTTLESKKTAGDTNTVWTFPETPRLSTYLFSLHAGPYHKWESRAGAIPLRLFARESLAKFVVVKDWFTPTKQGLKFYGDYFAYPYPFKKYDQLIVPDFNAGAMENVGAVTFTEGFVNRGKSTREDRMGLADVLLHEMAHMWFGDLVTMRWWNGLWLNESFATYMSHVASSQATEFKDAWIPFFARGKSRAYVEDQLVTTHPVEGKVPDTSSAMANFDNITYGKGASLLKQLNFYVGAEAFRDGVRTYFKTHAYKNTRIDDFVSAIEHASKKDLQGWSKAWFQTSGVDTMTADYACADGKISGFTLKTVGPNGEASPRAHRTRVALYTEKSGHVRPLRIAEVEYRGPSTEVAELKGSPCPAMVDPNEDDQDYVKVRLDPKSLAYASANVSKIESSYARIVLWPNLVEMVRDVALTPQEFLEAVTSNIPTEQDLIVARAMTSRLGDIVYYLPQTSALEKSRRSEKITALEHALVAKLAAAAPGSDWQLLALEQFIGIAETGEARDQIVRLLNGETKIKGLVIDVDHRWEMIVRLAALGDGRVTPLLKALGDSDKSERGVEMALAADAAQPTLDVKRAWIARLTNRTQTELSFSRKREVMWNLLPRIQDGLRASLASDYYATLPRLLSTQELNFLTLYTRTLMPATCTLQSAADIETFLKKNSAQFPPPVVKALRNGQQEDSRCVAIRAKAASL